MYTGAWLVYCRSWLWHRKLPVLDWIWCRGDTHGLPRFDLSDYGRSAGGWRRWGGRESEVGVVEHWGRKLALRTTPEILSPGP